ncbi:LCP family protein [Patescibacteria group bacterium]|nr:LCP family protein [Patescibacteria group bacterium]
MKLKRIRLARIKIAIIHFFQSHLKIIGLIFLVGLLVLSLVKINLFFKKLNIVPRHVIALFQDPVDHLSNSNGRTNFLLLGIKGENETDVADLADTIILASYQHSTKQTTIISIPRDLWIDSLKTKINAVYHYGEQRNPPVGLNLIQASIQETLGLPVHYTVVVNFNSFIEVIDLLGGVEVNVETSFTDSLFPIPGKENDYPIESRYETVSFEQGLRTMDGQTALKFVRSRHAGGDEGTDFARNKRQQLVIKALRQKLLSANVIFNESTRSQLFGIMQKNLVTNLKLDDYPSMIKLLITSRSQPFGSIGLLTESNDGEIAILENPPKYLYQNQWVLIAKDGNWPALKQYIQNSL